MEVVGLVAAVLQLAKFTREIHSELSRVHGLRRRYRTWTMQLSIQLSRVEQLSQQNMFFDSVNPELHEILKECKDEIKALVSLLQRCNNDTDTIKKLKGAVRLLMKNREIAERVSYIQNLAWDLQGIVNWEEMRHIRLQLIRTSASADSSVLLPASYCSAQVSLSTPSVHVQVYRKQLTELLQHQDSLALKLEEQKRYIEAKGIHEQALVTKQAMFGPWNPETLLTIDGLGTCLEGLGQNELAREKFYQAWCGRQYILHKDHPDLLRSLSNVANTCYRDGDLYKAESMHRECHEQRIKVLGELHLETLKSKSNIAIMNYARRQWDTAEKQFRPLIVSLEITVGPDHPESIKATMNLAKVIRESQRYDEAELLMRQALACAQMSRDDSQPIVVDILQSLCILHHIQGRITEALDLAMRVRKGRENIYGPHHLRTHLSILYITELEQELVPKSV